MRCNSVPDIRLFMSRLLTSPMFDDFTVSEASVTTFVRFQVDGLLHPSFFDSDEESSEEALCPWSLLKPKIVALIRGKTPPLSMKLTLKAPRSMADPVLSQAGASNDQYSLYLTILYQDRRLLVTSGTAARVFTLDRSADRAWDEALAAFLSENGIASESV